MNHRQTLKAAWADYWSDQDDRPPINHYFECGFDAAWDALMNEIRPLVADLRTNSALRQSDMNEIINHRKAVIRLRELVWELEQ